MTEWSFGIIDDILEEPDMREEFCLNNDTKTKRETLISSIEFVDFWEAHKSCAAMKGYLPRPKNAKEAVEIYNDVRKRMNKNVGNKTFLLDTLHCGAGRPTAIIDSDNNSVTYSNVAIWLGLLWSGNSQ